MEEDVRRKGDGVQRMKQRGRNGTRAREGDGRKKKEMRMERE